MKQQSEQQQIIYINNYQKPPVQLGCCSIWAIIFIIAMIIGGYK